MNLDVCGLGPTVFIMLFVYFLFIWWMVYLWRFWTEIMSGMANSASKSTVRGHQGTLSSALCGFLVVHTPYSARFDRTLLFIVTHVGYASICSNMITFTFLFTCILL